MLRDLLAIVQTGKFEDCGRIDISRAQWETEKLVIDLRVIPDGARSEIWTIECTEVMEYMISRAENCGLNRWTDDHPAIAQYTEPHECLYFGQAAADPERFLGRLWLIHQRVTDDWIPFDRYLNASVPIRELVKLNFGMIASGPSFLIGAYSEILAGEGMEPKRTDAGAGMYLRNAEMLHFGESYVVAQCFSATRIVAQ